MTTDLSAHDRLSTLDRTWPHLERVTGAVGLAAIVLIFGSVIVIGEGEPPTVATVAQSARYFREADGAWLQAASALFAISLLVFLWFAVGLSQILRRAEPDPPWCSTVAQLSGVLAVAFGLVNTSIEAAAHRGDVIDPTVAAYAWDVGTFGFANARLALGGFALAAGLAARASGLFPRWLAWLGIVSGALLVLARFVWSADVLWTFPYLAMWLWMLITCVLLVRRGPSVSVSRRTAP
ncbi:MULTISPECIES: DUF4386 family protein [unclassified Pseudofrankia]|uniref:DUF4386 family protein n=1 Tax=unclassified Pseudofrankia TaxID=2994372 RepID=UPI0008D95417|nr:MULTISPECIES: DUF4386 family protein [unclassified Pseudofrankia]MDT3444775.1 DUF4386 family protein [Pseudofrankia sp. BMG5.37]OHV50507.1 hypothetical protein BCD48_10455 [Pseudofrankia sp. BMG5.36]